MGWTAVGDVGFDWLNAARGLLVRQGSFKTWKHTKGDTDFAKHSIKNLSPGCEKGLGGGSKKII
jgi:hypothetical protein